MTPAQSESPAVSVVIAAFNAERTITETLESIAAQTFRDFEVIVVDDGSTDRTPKIAAGFSQTICLRQPNRGQPAARNRGIAAARGGYVAFVDADDLWKPEKLEKQVKFLAAHPESGMVYSDAEVFDAASGNTICRVSQKCRLHEGDVLERLLLKSFIPSPTPMVRRALFSQTGVFDEAPELAIGEDWNMWLKIAACSSVGVVREPLAKVRMHAASMTSTANVETSLKAKRLIVERAVQRNPERLSTFKARALIELEISAGMRYLRLGKPSNARALFAAVLRERPASLSAQVGMAATWMPARLAAALGGRLRGVRSASPNQMQAEGQISAQIPVQPGAWTPESGKVQ
jgi:glycosyltransferase involved in cell wall biosynthesis